MLTDGASIFVAFDCNINSLCLIMMSSFYEDLYRKLCCFCNKMSNLNKLSRSRKHLQMSVLPSNSSKVKGTQVKRTHVRSKQISIQNEEEFENDTKMTQKSQSPAALVDVDELLTSIEHDIFA